MIPDTSLMMPRRDFLLWGAGAVAAGVLPAPLAALAAGSELPPMTIYKSESCLCCAKWVDHVKAAGFKTTVHDRDPIDPTKLSADELVAELQDLTKKLLAYGARAPKELMLFVKNMMFLDGAIARLAPDLDILGEIEKVHIEIAQRHGERLAADMGFDPSLAAAFDMQALKNAMGVPDVERLTYRDVQARREVMRKNFEEKTKRKRPGA